MKVDAKEERPQALWIDCAAKFNDPTWSGEVDEDRIYNCFPKHDILKDIDPGIAPVTPLTG